MKKLHTFQVTFQKDGSEVVKNVIIAKPTPRQLEEGEMEFAAQLTTLIKRGIMTRAMLYKKYEDIGNGILPESVEAQILDKRRKYIECSLEFTRLEAKASLSASEKIKKAELTKEISDLQKELVDIETAKDSVFNSCADRLASNAMIYWWLFELVYVQNEESEEPVKLITGKNFSDKKDRFFDWIENEPEFSDAAKDKIIGFVSFVYYSQSSPTEEDFRNYENEFFKPEVTVKIEEKPKISPKKTPKGLKRGRPANEVAEEG